MSWFPGWDSIASTSWWSGLFFWASIGSLMLLGASEVISHRYSERKDELVEIQQIAEKQAHDDEIARLHLETAQAVEKAEELRQRNLELEKAISPRNLSASQQKKIADSLRGFSDVQFVTQAYSTDVEGRRLEDQITRMLVSAGFRFLQRGGNPPPQTPIAGVQILSNEAGIELARALCTALKDSDIQCNIDDQRVAGGSKTLTIWIGVKPIAEP